MARFAEMGEASGGHVSVLERHLEALLAAPPAQELSWEEIHLPPDCHVVIEVVTPAEAAVTQALAALGVAPAECHLLTDLAQACASVARRGAPGEEAPGAETPGEEAPEVKRRAAGLVDAISTLSRAVGRLDRVMVTATREVTAAQGALLLAEKGTELDELTASQRESWRAKAKSRTRTELEFATGCGVGEVRDLVALATMPATVRGPVGSALASGEASWRLVRGYVGAAGHLPTELAAGVANALFGTDSAVAATERLSSDREFTGRPWAHREFYRALDREVAKAEADLDEDQRRRRSRAKALAGADAWGRMDDDGTGVFGMRCTAAQLAAILDRLEGAARRAKANGDTRALGQIRSAVAATLLLRGTVPTPDLPEDPDLITPEQTEQLAAILAGLPAAVLNVIVPLNFLHPDGGEETADEADDEGDDETAGATDDEAGDEPARATGDRGHDESVRGTDDETEDETAQGTEGGEVAGGRAGDPARPRPNPDCGEDSARPPPQGRFGSGMFGIGEVQGRRAMFLPPEEVTGLALTPGSVMHRLVTDPVSGRCLERSTKAYPFTPAMKTQIAFADGSCRAPGCVIPGVQCQFDHVTEFGTPGGETCEGNGALAHPAHHDKKTKKYLDVVINERRDMTWETLLGKIYQTKAHDYTQYSTWLREATDQVLAAAEEDRGEAVDLAIYQALSYRTGGGWLVAEDDEEFDDHRFQAWDRISLTRRDPQTGRLANGPSADVVQAERDRLRGTGTAPDTDGESSADDPETPGDDQVSDPGDVPPPF